MTELAGKRGAVTDIAAAKKEFEKQISKQTRTREEVCTLVCKVMNFAAEMLIPQVEEGLWGRGEDE